MRTWEIILVTGFACCVISVLVIGWGLTAYWAATHQEYDEEKES